MHLVCARQDVEGVADSIISMKLPHAAAALPWSGLPKSPHRWDPTRALSSGLPPGGMLPGVGAISPMVKVKVEVKSL